MTEQTRISLRKLATALAVVLCAAIVGLSLAPRQAAATTLLDGYTCAPYDVCMPGDRECCYEYTQIPPGQGRCSTSCDIIIDTLEVHH